MGIKQKKRKNLHICKIPSLSLRAENEARTRDPNLGKVVLYQLSYFRTFGEGNETRTHTTILSLPPQSSASTNSAIPPTLGFNLTSSGCPEQDSNLHVSQHSHLKRARLPFRHLGKRFCKIFLFRAENEARTRDPNLGKVVLYQLSYFRIKKFCFHTSIFKPISLPRLIPFSNFLGQGCALPTELFPHLRSLSV